MASLEDVTKNLVTADKKIQRTAQKLHLQTVDHRRNVLVFTEPKVHEDSSSSKKDGKSADGGDAIKVVNINITLSDATSK